MGSQIDSETTLIERSTNDDNSDSNKVGQQLDDNTDCKQDEKKASMRLRVDNLPPFFGMKQVRKFLKDQLDGMEYQRLKTMSRVAIFSLASEENTQKAMEKIQGLKLKKFELNVKRVADEPNVPTRTTANSSNGATASDLVTPLAGIPYTDQLARKQKVSETILQGLIRQICGTGIYEARQWRDLLKPMLPSPVVTGYRNKCEFCIARSSDSNEICVGFVQGRMAEREIRIVDVQTCTNLTLNTLHIVKHFEQFVRSFDTRLDAFDEFKRQGFWKMLTVRDFHGDCMLVVTAHPHSDSELVQAAKKALIEKFICFGSARESVEFRVTSLYWQTIENASDSKVYEHLAGAPYIYETILGARFQISPSTFFQTNSRGAEVLYSHIGDALNVPYVNIGDATCVAVEQDIMASENVNNASEADNENDTPPADESENVTAVEKTELASKVEDNAERDESEPSGTKRPKIDESLSTVSSGCSTVLLDICCGAGSIGICLMKRLQHLTRLGKFSGFFGCVGVELIPEAIRDAKINAANNGFSSKSCRYIIGQAENIFKELSHHMPENCKFSNVDLLGIIDPPRAGVSDKVVIGCRKLEQLKRLVYVSCDPRGAMKNLTDLCRPLSNKYEGTPFRIMSIQPVDMFPQTEHFEWVVELQHT